MGKTSAAELRAGCPQSKAVPAPAWWMPSPRRSSDCRRLICGSPRSSARSLASALLQNTCGRRTALPTLRPSTHAAAGAQRARRPAMSRHAGLKSRQAGTSNHYRPWLVRNESTERAVSMTWRIAGTCRRLKHLPGQRRVLRWKNPEQPQTTISDTSGHAVELGWLSGMRGLRPQAA